MLGWDILRKAKVRLHDQETLLIKISRHCVLPIVFQEAIAREP